MESEPILKVLVADDEPLAREGIRLLLARDPRVELVGEAASGLEAVDKTRSLKPDLLFLDVQMPELDGFEVLRALSEEDVPAVVFVTAFDRFALRAFEVHALDYLLKPFDDERFREALERAKRDRVRARAVLAASLPALLQDHAGRPDARPVSRLVVRDIGRVVFVSVEEIDWIEAQDYYVALHVGPKSYLHRETMTSLEGRLDPALFLRIHRSAMVNVKSLRELRREGRRDLVAVLANGVELKVARSARVKLEQLR